MFGQVWFVEPPPLAGALGAGEGVAAKTGTATASASTAAAATRIGRASLRSNLARGIRFTSSDGILAASLRGEPQILVRTGLESAEGRDSLANRRVAARAPGFASESQSCGPGNVGSA